MAAWLRFRTRVWSSVLNSLSADVSGKREGGSRILKLTRVEDDLVIRCKLRGHGRPERGKVTCGVDDVAIAKSPVSGVSVEKEKISTYYRPKLCGSTIAYAPVPVMKSTVWKLISPCTC